MGRKESASESGGDLAGPKLDGRFGDFTDFHRLYRRLVCRTTRIASVVRTMGKLFIVVSGLPGSGKTTLARRLAPVLALPVIDKDDILECLFESKGVGDATWRRQLSRESDQIFQQEAMASGGAFLVSFWHLAGMPLDSGTPTDWLAKLSGPVLNLHCDCDPEIAAARFLRRKRHSGHLDVETSATEVLTSLRRISNLPPLNIHTRINVETSQEPALDGLAAKILHALNDDDFCPSH